MILKKIPSFSTLPKLVLLFSLLIMGFGTMVALYLTLTSGSGDVRQQASSTEFEIQVNLIDTGPSEPEYLPNSLIVKMKGAQPGVRVASTLTSRIAQLDAVDPSLVIVQAVPELNQLNVINFDETLDVDLDQAILDLEADPDVEYAHKVGVYRALSVNDPYYKQAGKTVLEHYQWNFARINLAAAWAVLGSKGNSDITVAIIDTGVAFKDYTDPNTGVVYKKSPELSEVTFVHPRKLSSVDCSVPRLVAPPLINNEHALDDGGHGTHVASTVVQATNNGQHAAGIAPGVKLMPINVFTKCPGRDDAFTNDVDVALAINYAIDHGADVINMSLGGQGELADFQTTGEAIQRAVDQGVVVVVAAGNDAKKTPPPPIAVPAAFPQTIAVGATRFDNKRANYSQYVPNQGRGIDIMAPGGQIFSDENTIGPISDQNSDYLFDGIVQQTIMPGDPGNFTSIKSYTNEIPYLCIGVDPVITLYTNECGLYQGTSMAAPHVTGVVALMLSANPNLTVNEVKSILADTAQKTSPDYNETEYGAGLIDAKRAVEEAIALVDIPVSPSPSPSESPSPSPSPSVTPDPGEIACSTAAECNDNNECTTDLCLSPGTTSSSCQHQVREAESCDDDQGLCTANAECRSLEDLTLISLQTALDGVPYCELSSTSCATKDDCAAGQFCVSGKCGNCFPPQATGQTVSLQATFISAKQPAVSREVTLTYDPASLSYVTLPANKIILEQLESGPYIVVLKGPKHLATRYCYYQDFATKQCLYSSLVEATASFDEAKATEEKFIWLSPGKSYQLNLQAAPVKAGDLPISGAQNNQQDGMANVLDYSFLLSCLGNSSRSEVCLSYADLDYSGQVNNIDLGLIRRTLKEVVDQY